MFSVKVFAFFGCLILTFGDNSLEVEQPPAIFPTDNSTYKIIPKNDSLLHKDQEVTAPLIFPKEGSNYTIIAKNDSLLQQVPELSAPLVFPENGSNYTIINNSTILHNLVSNTNKTEHKNYTEVADLNKEPVEILPGTVISNKTHEEEAVTSTRTTEKPVETMKFLHTSNKITDDYQKTTTEDNPEFDTELLQSSDDPKTEEARKLHPRLGATSHEGHEHPQRGGVPFVQGQWPALLAGIFALIAVVCYVGLLTWRRFLEHRYGNREMLINEEETYNYSDMRNFEL